MHLLSYNAKTLLRSIFWYVTLWFEQSMSSTQGWEFWQLHSFYDTALCLKSYHYAFEVRLSKSQALCVSLCLLFYGKRHYIPRASPMLTPLYSRQTVAFQRRFSLRRYVDAEITALHNSYLQSCSQSAEMGYTLLERSDFRSRFYRISHTSKCAPRRGDSDGTI